MSRSAASIVSFAFVISQDNSYIRQLSFSGGVLVTSFIVFFADGAAELILSPPGAGAVVTPL
ncbi:MAG: hypothetical protein FWD58_03915 [Firmicutes bacterium]|nr:hypothetical protein [Bacillota bacterium]